VDKRRKGSWKERHELRSPRNMCINSYSLSLLDSKLDEKVISEVPEDELW
jgi:hypothetical protein